MKRHPSLQPLSDDHHGALVLARHVRRAAAQAGEALREAWPGLRRRFAGELEPHFVAEEQRLLPQLAAAGEGRFVERARADHARLRELVAGEPSAAAASEFASLLHDHVRFEERELFPRAERLLPADVLDAAGQAALAARGALSVLDLLGADHERLDSLLADVKRLLAAGDAPGAAARFADYRGGLERHIAAEEEVLFPAFEGAGLAGPIQVMCAEHVEIRRLLGEVAVQLTRGEGGHAALLAALTARSLAHDGKEERILYPAMDRAGLPAPVRAELRRRIAPPS
jgi:iron-sulfur cluster repair protein YtfE (RIC family)